MCLQGFEDITDMNKGVFMKRAIELEGCNVEKKTKSILGRVAEAIFCRAGSELRFGLTLVRFIAIPQQPDARSLCH